MLNLAKQGGELLKKPFICAYNKVIFLSYRNFFAGNSYLCKPYENRFTNSHDSTMTKGDIRAELELLKSLEGAAFGIKLKEIAARKEFRALPGEPFIYTVGEIQDEDYPSLLMAARKAVEHGYRVFMLPNPHGVKTPDYILERRGVYKLFDLKNISGKNIVHTRLKESITQANRALLNMPQYSTRKLVHDIRKYFVKYPDAIEVLIFKGKDEISVSRRFAMSQRFYFEFKKMFER